MSQEQSSLYVSDLLSLECQKKLCDFLSTTKHEWLSREMEKLKAEVESLKKRFK